ncbi:hypothetical protein ACFQU2_07210 [Siccirubricoccus deserti]
MNLGRLVGATSLTMALETAAAQPVVTVQPRLETDATGTRLLRIPVEAGYGGPLFPVGQRAM